MKVSISNRQGKVILESIESKTGKVSEVQLALQQKFPKYSIHRQRLTFVKDGNTHVLASNEQLATYGIKDDDVIIFKDLGPQIGWSTVFLIEYFGPILIHALFYLFPTVFYGSASVQPHSNIQTIAFVLVVLHFIKRELETLYVHRFSNATMPIRNLPKNCFHYWVLGGVFVAYPLYQPGYQSYFGEITNSTVLMVLVGLWSFAQFSNLKTHLILRNLRPAGTTIRKIPKGYGFDLVSCPNYLFEISCWIIFSILTGSVTSWIFTLIGAGQMYLWAVKKHLRYKKDFGTEYPKNRKVLIPFAL
ncbi:3-oxo-5-alpha-steroid 4-dehydrogenase-domain-containing protein [Globomyces pollinis-pini]|nr:3-oxo-5-alpha-steroid 4-dehydrogenase-domain-containing protein [Globomyces pollinis-pini]